MTREIQTRMFDMGDEDMTTKKKQVKSIEPATLLDGKRVASTSYVAEHLGMTNRGVLWLADQGHMQRIVVCGTLCINWDDVKRYKARSRRRSKR